MDIALNVLPRPKPGREAEFETLLDLLDAGRWGNPPEPNPYMIEKRSGMLGLWRKKQVFDWDTAARRFDDISDDPGITLNAPVVGKHDQADAWAGQAVVKGELDAKTQAEALTKFKGLYVFELLPVCDGFPVYSPNIRDKGYDRSSFYGSILEAYEAQIGAELLETMHGPLLGTELAEWAVKLRNWADEFAKTLPTRDIIGNRDFVSDDDGGVETCLHAVDQAARWAAYWSALGHGIEPVFY